MMLVIYIYFFFFLVHSYSKKKHVKKEISISISILYISSLSLSLLPKKKVMSSLAIRHPLRHASSVHPPSSVFPRREIRSAESCPQATAGRKYRARLPLPRLRRCRPALSLSTRRRPQSCLQIARHMGLPHLRRRQTTVTHSTTCTSRLTPSTTSSIPHPPSSAEMGLCSGPRTRRR